MPLRRTLALAAGLVVLAAPALSSCGFNAATGQQNVIADGGYNLDGNMRVLGSRIVASQDNQGYFIATITLNPSEDAVTEPISDARQHALVGLESDPGAESSIEPVSGIHKTVNTEGITNLASPQVGGIPVTGTFSAGDVIPITLTFADGEKLTVQTPVVPDCHEYAGAGQTGSPSPSPTPTTGATPGPYDCFYPSLPPLSE